MRKFLDQLIENVILLNKEKNIVFVNKELREKIGYDSDENITLEEMNRFIKIKDEFILIKCRENDVIKASYSISNLDLSYDECYIVKVNWNGDKIHQLESIEKFVDSLEVNVLLKDVDNNYIYVNKTVADKYNLSKEDTKKYINSKDIDKKHISMIEKNDNYVIDTKNRCINEVTINKNGIDKFYEVRKYPILDNLAEVKVIATVLKDITFTKSVQLQTFKSLDILENMKDNKVDIDEYKDNLFNGLKDIFKDYFNTDLFNIWEYSKEKESIEPYFLNEKLKEVSYKRKSIHISEKDVRDHIEGRIEEVICVDLMEIFGVEGVIDSEKINNYYVIRQPIIYGDEFIGLLNVNYESYPIFKAIKNDLIKSVCSQVGFIIKYMRFLKRLNEEKNNKEKIQEELEEFIEVATDIIVKVDMEGNFISVSTGAVDILGWSKAEMLNMKWLDLVHHEDLNDTVSFVEMFKCSPVGKLMFINRIRCFDGSYKWIHWGKGFYKAEEGYILSSGRDITRETELALKENLVEKSIELERVRTEFFANLSHELKTPLTLIMAVVQVVENYVDEFNDKNRKDNFERYMNVLKQNSYRLLRLVTNLIDVTRIDAGFYHLNAKNNNIVEVVEDIVMSVVTYCEGKNINLIFNTETEEEIIACDGDQIERVILNLLSNAIKFTNSNGDIYVDISLNEEYVVIKIEDSGIGIAKEKLEFIFDRFTQVDNLMTRKCEGSGIGLSLVKSIVELHNGNIKVESLEGRGSTFIVNLPRKKLFENEEFVDNKIDDVDSKLERCSIEFSDIYDL